MPRIEEHFKNPLELQHTSLDELIFSGRNTEWGKKYGYSEIGNYEQFKAKVPAACVLIKCTPYFIPLRAPIHSVQFIYGKC